MLGLSSSLSSGAAALKSIVKSGLQLFYKADRTQAPLGEEQIRNNSFNELGSEEVDNGDFATDLSNWTIAGSDSTHTVTHTSNGARFKSDTTDPTLTFTSDTANIVSGKSYQIKVVISEYQGSSGIKIQSSATGGVKYLFDSVDTFTYNFTAVSDSSNPIQFYRDTANVDITIESVSLKEVDPNNRWTVSNDTPSEQTVQIRDGSFFIEYDSTATKGAANINVPLAGVANQEYEIKVVVDSINNDEKLKVQLGNSAHNLSVGANIFKATSTTTGTLTLGRTNEDDSVTATVSSVSLRAITNSIKDHSTNSNDGILYSGKALEFDTDDGSNDFIVLNDANLTGEFTVCTWVEPHSFTQCNIFGDTANQNWIRIHSASSITVKIANVSTDYVELTHGGNIALNKWSRVVVTRGSDNIIRFGINGTLYSPSNVARAGNFNFNRLGVKDGLEMNGALADVQVYDKAWNYTDVKYDWENPDKDVFDRVGEAQVLGGELVDNRDYSNGLTDWSPQIPSGQVVEVVNNQLHVKYDSSATQSSTGVYQTFITPHRLYEIKVDVESVVGTMRVQFGSQVRDITEAGVHTFVITPVSETLYLIRGSNASSCEFFVNSISVKEVTTHASHILPTDCKSLLRLNEGAGDRVYDAAPVLGAEKVVNGDFALDSDWAEDTGWDIDVVNNKATCNGSQTGNSNLSQVVYTPGKVHKTIITVDSVDAGSISIFTGTSNSQLTITEAGTYTIIAKALAGSDTIYIQANALFEGSISNVSVKEIKPAESFFITGDKNFLHQQPYIPQYAMSSFSKKMVFTDVDTDVDVGAQSIADNQAFSFSFWYAHQASDSSVENYILSKHDSTHDYIRINNQNEALELKVNGSSLAYDIGDLNNFKTSHIVLTRASGSDPITKCYVNGTLEVTDTSSSADGVFEYQQIGAGGTLNAGTFFLDELAHFNKELSLTEVQEIFNSGTALDCRDHSSASNLEGYWRNNGADTWTDLSTNSNNGTVNGSPTEIFLQEVPFFGRDSLGMFMNKPRLGGLNLNASGYVNIEDNNDLDFGTGDFTMECWVTAKYENVGSSINVILGLGGNTSQAGSAGIVSFDSNKLGGYVSGATLSANSTFTEGNWYHVVITRTSGTCKLYIDTVLQDDTETSGGSITNSNAKQIGKDTTTNRGYDGVVDDVKLYSEDLTPTEIKKNYNATKAKHKN